MARYTDQSVDGVRDAVDFVELVSARTELRRAGVNRYEGLCVFHDERTPSFGIDPIKKVYYCFGCQANGDLFTFVQETEGVDFPGALELLAERYGVELDREQEDPQEADRRRRRERLLDLLRRTRDFYERYLWESKEAGEARAYLVGRGLDEQSLRDFHVGFAPEAWERVIAASRRGGFSEQELRATGLAQARQRDGRLIDRFRGRIMFPLADLRGRVIGFGARAMSAEQRPKYLNSSDNEIYHKGSYLYGADLARAPAARAGRTIVCEGYTDVIALHQAGLRETVGLMGTALTPDQLSGLGRLAPTVLLALDADSAGQEAMLRAARVAAQRKLELRVVPLPAGADPAELVQRDGAQALTEVVEASLAFVRFRVERSLAVGDSATPEGRDRIIEDLRPVFATLPPSAMRMELTRIVSGQLAMPEHMIERLLPARETAGGSDISRPQSDANVAPSSRSAAALERGEEQERTFLALCIAAPELGAPALASLAVDEHFTAGLTRRAAIHLAAGRLGDPLAELDEAERDLAVLLTELIVRAGREQPDDGALEVQRLQLELALVERKIHVERARGGGEVSQLARRRAELKLAFDLAQERALRDP